jgi:hypothetical protein
MLLRDSSYMRFVPLNQLLSYIIVFVIYFIYSTVLSLVHR